MKFRIKVRETIGGKKYYIPQYRKYFIWINIGYIEFLGEESASCEIIKKQDELDSINRNRTKRIFYI